MNSSEKMICYCSKVTKGDIEAALEHGARTFADVKRITGACTIGNCREMNPEGT